MLSPEYTPVSVSSLPVVRTVHSGQTTGEYNRRICHILHDWGAARAEVHDQTVIGLGVVVEGAIARTAATLQG